MRSVQKELEAIRDYIKGKIAEEKFKMVRPPVEGDEDSPLALVKPKVAIGNIPHSNFSLYGTTDDRFFQAPYLLIGYENAIYGPNNEEINILIQGCAYTASEYEREEESIGFPDNEGILDITQMLERVMGWCQELHTFPAMMNYEIGNYGAQAYTYPYNFGYLLYQLKTNVGANPRTHTKLF